MIFLGMRVGNLIDVHARQSLPSRPVPVPWMRCMDSSLFLSMTIHTAEIESSVSKRRNWYFGLIQPKFGNSSHTVENKLLTIQKKNPTTISLLCWGLRSTVVKMKKIAYKWRKNYSLRRKILKYSKRRIFYRTEKDRLQTCFYLIRAPLYFGNSSCSR